MVLDPGHFHAALVQKNMYPGIAPEVAVYAPLGTDLLEYLARITQFNTRADSPTSWNLNVHTGTDFLGRMLRERPGNVVIVSGHNRPKMERISAAIDAGLNVLADKPWIIRSADLPELARVLDTAEERSLVAYDIMTERFEITSILQRELVNDDVLFGTLLKGTQATPAITAKSVHHIMKMVAGTPLRRPAWFFDIEDYGEGLADVGTHVVDLVQWTAFPTDRLDYRTDVQVLGGKRWPTPISAADFEKVTGVTSDHDLEYFCNNSVRYALKGVHVHLEILWNWEAPHGAGDVYEACFRGSRASIELRQGKAEHWLPELYVIPNGGSEAVVSQALTRKVEALQSEYPGVSVDRSDREFRIVIPRRYRVGHEAHFTQVANRFFEYLKAPRTLPAWEKSNMLVKYAISTRGVEIARAQCPNATTK